MARAKKTTTAKPKAKAPAVNTTVKKGVDAIVNALNEDYAGVCKRVYEQQVTDDSLEARDKAAAQARLEEIEAGKYKKVALARVLELKKDTPWHPLAPTSFTHSALRALY